MHAVGIVGLKIFGLYLNNAIRAHSLHLCTHKTVCTHSHALISHTRAHTCMIYTYYKVIPRSKTYNLLIIRDTTLLWPVSGVCSGLENSCLLVYCVVILQMIEKQSTNIAMLNKEYRSAKIELEQLRRNVSENAARNPIICDELQVSSCCTTHNF